MDRGCVEMIEHKDRDDGEVTGVRPNQVCSQSTFVDQLYRPANGLFSARHAELRLQPPDVYVPA